MSRMQGSLDFGFFSGKVRLASILVACNHRCDPQCETKVVVAHFVFDWQVLFRSLVQMTSNTFVNNV
jgi:hypothetical protein